MKKTYYLFNPGELERKDNTLKFTPISEDGSENSVGEPRYLPVEDINEFYVFGSLRFRVLCFIVSTNLSSIAFTKIFLPV